MKTAMQQYIEWINSNDFRAAEDRGDMQLIEKMELQFIELEKQQIVNAFAEGINHISGDDSDSIDKKFGDLYYRQSFN